MRLEFSSNPHLQFFSFLFLSATSNLPHRFIRWSSHQIFATWRQCANWTEMSWQAKNSFQFQRASFQIMLLGYGGQVLHVTVDAIQNLFVTTQRNCVFCHWFQNFWNLFFRDPPAESTTQTELKCLSIVCIVGNLDDSHIVCRSIWKKSTLAKKLPFSHFSNNGMPDILINRNETNTGVITGTKAIDPFNNDEENSEIPQCKTISPKLASAERRSALQCQLHSLIRMSWNRPKATGNEIGLIARPKRRFLPVGDAFETKANGE